MTRRQMGEQDAVTSAGLMLTVYLLQGAVGEAAAVGPAVQGAEAAAEPVRGAA